MTRKLSRNYSLSAVVPFIAILTLLIAVAVLAQTSGAGQTTGRSNTVLPPARAARRRAGGGERRHPRATCSREYRLMICVNRVTRRGGLSRQPVRRLRRGSQHRRATTPPRDARTSYRASAATDESTAQFVPRAGRSLPIPAPAPDTSQPSVDWSLPGLRLRRLSESVRCGKFSHTHTVSRLMRLPQILTIPGFVTAVSGDGGRSVSGRASRGCARPA